MFATGTVAVHEGLKACGDVDNGVAICEFADGRTACFYASRTMAHGHETLTEIIGTDGRLTVGREGRMNQVQISDAHGIRTLTTPTFYERFAEAFLREDTYFVECVRGDVSAVALVARCHRGHAHRHRAAHLARAAPHGGTVGLAGRRSWQAYGTRRYWHWERRW